jgi:hypothetical protein
MGARAEYSRWGGINRSHIDKSQQVRRTFKTSGDFFNFLSGGSDAVFRGFAAKNPRKIRAKSRKNHCAAGRLASFAADLSDAIEGSESFSALLTEALLRSGAFSAAG